MLMRFRSFCFHRHMPRNIPDNSVPELENRTRKESPAVLSFRIWSAVGWPQLLKKFSNEV